MLSALWNGPCKGVLVSGDHEEEEPSVVRAYAAEEFDEWEPLMNGGMYVRSSRAAGPSPFTDTSGLDDDPEDCVVVDAERHDSSPSRARLNKARTAWVHGPGTLEVAVPQEFVVGSSVIMHSNSGRTFSLRLPADAQPGTTFKFYLKPAPEFMFEVPFGKQEGDKISVRRPNREEIIVKVPEGHCPGDVFPVYPPAVIVQVPEDCGPGDTLDFSTEEGSFTVVVPKLLQLGRYFAARIPSPNGPESDDGIDDDGGL